MSPEPASRATLAYHELCLWHDTSAGAGPGEVDAWIEPGAPGEGPAARRRLKSLLDASGVTRRLGALTVEEAPRECLLAVHDGHYLEHVAAIARAGGGTVGHNAPIGRRGFEIAALAAGVVCAAVDSVCGPGPARAFALPRPAGHHASRDTGMGNCVFNNIAVAVEHARAHFDVARCAVVDWDVHHGNGTEAIFYEDGDVLTISLHQDDWYPRRSGSPAARGEGPGRLANLNVPLPAGCGDGAYLAALEELVVPALDRHRPELVIVACGLDASAMDPFGRMLVTAAGFRAMTAVLVGAAEAICGGRLIVALEGGYSPLYVPFCGLAAVEALAGVRTGVADPYAARYEGEFQALQPHQRSALNQLIDLLN
jgi:acetoin utilization deacetylase AcuC-like enzyme